ncbi:gas vesicle protein GvpJ [Allostreptomyces psammosilenae]|uniref:Gas vesicle protein A n=1 Tax=Allostreptomyces psammosilenae TaxID=1892865 RepID=A0A852ZZJ5_9ACTN|nr:gas vesicle protein GvpJ [Allostreptomyces psammosilenae]NYI06114.1 hypothetical protein [Allostreptomyces psammosilenae]
MTVVTQQTTLRECRQGTLYDVLELILDRGLVIDVFARVSLVGIEVLRIDVRVVVASVDTYLRFAEVCNRLDLDATSRSKTLPEVVGTMQTQGARHKAKGVLSGAADTVAETVAGAVGRRRSHREEPDEEGGGHVRRYRRDDRHEGRED